MGQYNKQGYLAYYKYKNGHENQNIIQGQIDNTGAKKSCFGRIRLK